MKTLVIAGILNIHKQIMIHMVYFVTIMLNAVPATLGVSKIYSLCEIVTQRKLDMNKDCKVRFGTYVEAREDTQITNTMKSRTEECIVLGPSGNWEGSTTCFNLSSGVVVTRRTVTPLPMPDRIKKLVNSWGNQPRDRKYTGGIKFLDRKKNEFEWENENLGETIDNVNNPIYPNLSGTDPLGKIERAIRRIKERAR